MKFIRLNVESTRECWIYYQENYLPPFEKKHDDALTRKVNLSTLTDVFV